MECLELYKPFGNGHFDTNGSRIKNCFISLNPFMVESILSALHCFSPTSRRREGRGGEGRRGEGRRGRGGEGRGGGREGEGRREGEKVRLTLCSIS